MKQVKVIFLVISIISTLCGLSIGQSRTKPKAKAVRSAPSAAEAPAASAEAPKYLVTV
ncbi:MAG: hypothetical protein M3X11_25365 [Acidobacteriota bacterium]|nr:hypothetical protein [Acidobacteriota bacterium]